MPDDMVVEDRQSLLQQLEDWLEAPMLVLSLAWLALVLVELIWGQSDLLETFGTVIWIVFIAEFALRLWLAPKKLEFLKSNVLSLIALAIPAFRLFRLFRVFRLLRVARAARGLRLVRVIGTANRGMRALKASMGRRGIGYVLLLSLLVLVLGAAGMYALEADEAGSRGFDSYGDALWWTAMLLASLGTDYWPTSAEGRMLCFLISLYGLGVFGYITASFASFFVGRDAGKPETAAAASDLHTLRNEIALLRKQLAQR